MAKRSALTGTLSYDSYNAVGSLTRQRNAILSLRIRAALSPQMPEHIVSAMIFAVAAHLDERSTETQGAWSHYAIAELAKWITGDAND